MKKSRFIKAVFLIVFAGFCFADENAEEVNPSIDIDQIAQELETEENSDVQNETAEPVIEEEVFDETPAEDENETAAVLPKNENYWRGKTAVAAENEFPKGIFAMAKGFFPGDTLNVINSKTQKTTNVLVIGTIDQNDIVGIKFSQEAAQEIKINEKTDANVILDERINPPEMRETATAKLVIFGGDETDYSSFEQPVSTVEDEEILSTNEPSVIDEIAVEFDEEAQEAKADAEPSDSDEVQSVSDDSYAAIVLDVPETVEELAAAEEKQVFEEEKESAPVIAEPVPEVKEETKEEAVQPVEKVVKTEPVKKCEKKASVPYKKLIADERMVRKGYYIQLSFLTNEENLQKFVDKYGDDLKLFLIPHKNGYKVFAGVFNDDDKDYALEFVRSLGFKDAFVRKIR